MSSLNGSCARRTTVASLLWFHHGAVVTAERRKGTGRAVRSDRPADVLPESDEQFVDVEPVFFRYGPHQALLRCFRCLRPNEAQAVADSMHMGVRRDSRFSESVHEHAVRGLRPDLGKFDELLVGPGDRSPKLLQEYPAHLLDLERFLPVEADRLDQTLEIRAVRVGDGLRGIVLREQLLRRPLGHLVPRSLGQDRRDQDEVWILPLPDDLRQGRFPLVQVSRGKIAARQVPHDERDPLMDGRQSDQGLPPPYKWTRRSGRCSRGLLSRWRRQWHRDRAGSSRSPRKV